MSRRAARHLRRAGASSGVDYLIGLGVTAVELLPVHHSVPESFLVERGLTNYWGYNTIGFFAPHAAYSAAVRAGRPGGQVAEFQSMVGPARRRLRGDPRRRVQPHRRSRSGGPTLSFRGLDNAAYYRLDPSDPGRYIDTDGNGQLAQCRQTRQRFG